MAAGVTQRINPGRERRSSRVQPGQQRPIVNRACVRCYASVIVSRYTRVRPTAALGRAFLTEEKDRRMTPEQLTDFHEWLRAALPSTSTELLIELTRCHKFLPKSYQDMPRDSVELSEALRALEVKGLVEKIGSEWRWRCEQPKAEPQGVLFDA
jgi:hypothetical protein